MPLVPFNSVGGYSTGRTGYNVILESGLVNALAGISASGGVTFNSDVTIDSANTLNVSTITSSDGKTQLDIDNKASARVAIGDFLGAGNATNIFLRDNISVLHLSNPFGAIEIGDPQSLSTGSFVQIDSLNQIVDFGASDLSGINSISTDGNILLQNAEYIRNTTNGRIDFMPAPDGSTHYGMYLDFTSWGFGPRFGTIRSSDGALNTTGILWDAQLNLGANVRFNFGSDGQNGVVLSDTGNNTVQLFTTVTTGTNSGAVAIVDAAGVNAANRAPGVTHTNPNLYVYRAGSANANDFIRFEHDGTNGRIVSGGTSGISIEPGSGIVGVSGNIQVLENKIYVTNNARSWFL
jgi:hypothetical protein